MRKLITHILILQCVFVSLMVRSQTIGVGASAIYNFQSESFGVGARASIFPNNRFSFVPQVSYFFPFNKVTEYTLGLGLEGKFLVKPKFFMYGILHGGYNSWLSYNKSALEGAKPTNWNLEGGLGISTNRCLRPFLEYRYNVKFRETHLNLGILYIFGCSNGSSNAGAECPTF